MSPFFMLFLIFLPIVIRQPKSRCNLAGNQAIIVFTTIWGYFLGINSHFARWFMFKNVMRCHKSINATSNDSYLTIGLKDIKGKIDRFERWTWSKGDTGSSMSVVVNHYFCSHCLSLYSEPTFSVRSNLSILSNDLFLSKIWKLKISPKHYL